MKPGKNHERPKKGKRVLARTPDAPVLYRFMAKEEFFCRDVNTLYCTGVKYSVRKGNTKLDALVKQWVSEGKVEIY